MFSIGEFSRITQLSIKALRLYHEKGILVPSKIDLESNYRYYSTKSMEQATIIKQLKDMGFSLDEIKGIVRECSDDLELMRHVEIKLKEVSNTLREYELLKDKLELFLDNIYKGEKMNDISADIKIEQEEIGDITICGIRFLGRYDEVGPKFGKLFKICGHNIIGKPFSLYFDGEYKEENADIETCVAVKRLVNDKEIDCRVLKGGKAVTIIHKGSYSDIGQSYGKLYEYCRNNNMEILLPIREEYLKGPGMIFKGNPKKYITKIYMFYS